MAPLADPRFGEIFRLHYSRLVGLTHHIVILDRGRVVQSGPLADLAVGAEVRVTLYQIDDNAVAILQGFGRITARDADTVLLALDDAAAIPALTAALVKSGHDVRALVPLQRSLEEVFVDLIGPNAEEGQ